MQTAMLLFIHIEMFQFYFKGDIEMVKRTVRDKTYSLKDYLDEVQNGYICENADVQRMAGNFDNREINELIYTVLTSDHVPEIILAECNEDNHTYITDGLQRTTMFKKFKYGNYAITSAIDDPIIEYTRKKRDANGNIVKNERGQDEFEDVQIDIRNKTYETFDEELRKVFDSFQIRVIIHENCTMKRISKLIKRYNYQRPMTSSQKAFTYIDNFAVKARNIINKKFFIECAGFTEKEKIDGTIERVITESVMYMFHLDKWKKSSKSVCEYLNENSNDEEFSKYEEVIDRLGNIVTPDFNPVFISKNSFIWFKVFSDFENLGLDDKLFADFIRDFNDNLKDKVVEKIVYKDMENVSFSKLDKESGTKDKSLIMAKYEIINSLMKEYFSIQEHHNHNVIDNNYDVLTENTENESFIADVLNMNLEKVIDEIEIYNETLDSLTEKTIRDGSKLLNIENRKSLLALVAYSYERDVDLDEWLEQYAAKNNMYFPDQRKNFLHMKKDFINYIETKEKESA